jgi:hypothetical protein
MDIVSSPSIARQLSGTAFSRNPTAVRLDSQIINSDPLLPLKPSNGIGVDINNLHELDEFIAQDPSNIVQILPELSAQLQQFCITDPSVCSIIWKQLKPLFAELNSKLNLSFKKNTLPLPSCEAKPFKFINCHGEEWSDDYSWLNDRSNNQVLEYIERENNYVIFHSQFYVHIG